MLAIYQCIVMPLLAVEASDSALIGWWKGKFTLAQYHERLKMVRDCRVVVVEDVITTGGSALKAVDTIRGAGGIIAGVLALVDREEGGREALQDAGLHVIALATASEIVKRLPQA